MGKKIKKIKSETEKQQNVFRIQYPDMNKRFVWIGFFGTFLIQFLIYLISLAPTVTLEDSGELIAAAYTLGVPHQPGYPLFTILGKLFSYLPFGAIAFRVNLMSALFSALAIGILFVIVIHLIDEINAVICKNRRPVFPEYFKYVAGIIAALFTGLTPSYYSQALITEVYGINNFFTVLIILVILRWYRIHNLFRQGDDAKDRLREAYFLAYGLICGLTVSNHHTSLVFLPLGLLFIFIVDRYFLLNIKRLLKWTGCLIAGLTPYLYLPFSSSSNPPVDWGNPENWTNFWRVVTRHQYGLDLSQTRSFQKLTSQIGLHYQLFWEQFGWVLVIIGFIGLIALWMHRKPIFALTLLFALLTGPLVAYVTNADMTVRDPFAVAEQRALVSVMYLPFYLLWGGLMGAGFIALSVWMARKIKIQLVSMIIIGASLLYLVWFGYKNYQKENMSNYVYVERFFDNLLKVVEPNSIVIANWDPFVFPALYYQFAEKRCPDIIFLDVELLRRTWYIEMLRNNYPEYMSYSKKEADEFLSAVKPFEESEKFDPNFIQSKYISMINSMIDYHYETRPVYLTVYYPMRPLEKGIAPAYKKESCFVAERLIRPGAKLKEINYRQLDFSDFMGCPGSRDRMSDMLRNYYAVLFAEKALSVAEHDAKSALEYFDRSLEFVESPVIRKNIQQRQQSLKQMIK